VAESKDKDQRTEEATPRRLDEARREGQVAISTELVAALGLCAGFAALLLAGPQLSDRIGGVIVGTIRGLPTFGPAQLDLQDFASLIESVILPVGGGLALIIAPALAIIALAGYGQVGFVVAPKAIEPKPSKIDPIQGVSRLFSLRSVVRTAQAAAKVLLITFTVMFIAWTQIEGISRLGASELGPLLVGLGRVAMLSTGGALLVIVLLGFVDFFYQRFQHRRDLRMTKQELRDEHKLTEGDPHVKARVRQVQREMATRRMMSEVPKAAVVVTNPTHYAVALRYDRDADGRALQHAPTVVAKGVDALAQRIKQVAADADVHCYEDVALARALYAQVELGEEIPGELYAAVATVLGYVFRLRGELVNA
jgi:flagellar biosynthetic protein FlhB